MELDPLKICPRGRFALLIFIFSCLKFSAIIGAVALFERGGPETFRHSVQAGWLIGIAMFCALVIIDLVVARKLACIAYHKMKNCHKPEGPNVTPV